MTRLFDALAVEGTTRTTRDGYLVTKPVRVARAGVMDYLGTEVGRPEMAICRVYTPESVVFAQDTMSSYSHRPMTNDHPGEDVTAKNWKRHAVGSSGNEVLRDGDFVSVPLVLMDEAAITDFNSGKRELSMGRDVTMVFEDGVTPQGEPYNAVVTGMSMNHIALVDRARGGSQLRIGDNAPAPVVPNPGPNLKDETMPAETRVVLVDGISIELPLQGAQVVERLTRQVSDSANALTAANSAHSAALAAKDAEIDGLKAKVMDAAKLDAAVAERSDLIGKAKTLHDSDYTGKNADEIRKIAVIAKFGDSMAGKDAAYIAVRFDIAVEDAAKNGTGPGAIHDPLRAHLADRANTPAANAADTAYEKNNAKLSEAWRGAAQ